MMAVWLLSDHDTHDSRGGPGMQMHVGTRQISELQDSTCPAVGRLQALRGHGRPFANVACGHRLRLAEATCSAARTLGTSGALVHQCKRIQYSGAGQGRSIFYVQHKIECRLRAGHLAQHTSQESR